MIASRLLFCLLDSKITLLCSFVGRAGTIWFVGGGTQGTTIYISQVGIVWELQKWCWFQTHWSELQVRCQTRNVSILVRFTVI